ncbi:hypothetical protein FQN60_006417, partial [Etheostoma spectabile]
MIHMSYICMCNYSGCMTLNLSLLSFLKEKTTVCSIFPPPRTNATTVVSGEMFMLPGPSPTTDLS